MENLYLEEDEIYETQCGEIFFTSRGRIIFHCTLCEKKFHGYGFYEIHIQEHFLHDDEKQEVNSLNNENACFVGIHHDDPTKLLSLQVQINSRCDLTESNLNNDMEDDSISSDNIKSYQAQFNKFQTLKTEIIENGYENFTEYQDNNLDIDRNVNELKPTMLELKNNADCNLKQEKISISCLKPKTKQDKLRRICGKEEISNKTAIKNKTESENQTDLRVLDTDIREVIKRKVIIAKTTPEEDRKHKCPICDLGFKEKGNMKHHLQRHSDEKNFSCSYCDKRFYSSTERNTHLKTHTQERPYLCTECGRTFATRSRLGDHLKRHKEQKDYHCLHSGCQKSFYSSERLKNHMVVHSNERHLKCLQCDAAFKQKTALKNHIKLHENKREYKCLICFAEFNQKAGLFSHTKTVHKSV